MTKLEKVEKEIMIVESPDPIPEAQGDERRIDSKTILPLPSEVIAQIQSSATITSLTSVILGLVENSLDAQASKIHIDVDFGRGGCVVEDDGMGIPPAEFSGQGGLGKLHHTSKYNTSASSYGQEGLFLASLSALCLLKVTSHHRLYRSTSSIWFHHAKILSRQIPASETEHFICRDHGTKVSVRNLFGSMPVRIKQRSLAMESRGELERQWSGLKQSLAALFIASGQAVSFRAKDVISSKVFTFSDPSSQFSLLPAADNLNVSHSLSGRIRLALSILGQTGSISPSQSSSWIPTSASSLKIVITGAISLEPVPSKSTQFLSFGIHPLRQAAHNELYDCINGLFARSRFGVIENEEPPEAEGRRCQDKERFKQDGSTYKQKLTEKGVDRWPMFVLSISMKDRTVRSSTNRFVQTDLSHVIEVLDALINGWLSVHLFQPRKREAKAEGEGHKSQRNHSNSQSVSEEMTLLNQAPRRPAQSKISKALNDDGEPSVHELCSSVTSFNQLSRVKSSNCSSSNLSRIISTARRSSTAPQLNTVVDRADDMPTFGSAPSRAPSSLRQVERVLSTHPPLLYQSSQTQRFAPRETLENVIDKVDDIQRSHVDKTLDWTDPVTKERYKINARTGAAIAPEKTSFEERKSTCKSKFLIRHVRLKSTTKVATGGSQSTGWLHGVLETWQNPIFRTNEQNIPRVPLEIFNSTECCALPRTLSNFLSSKQMIMSSTIGTQANTKRLTKDALRKAKVIAQVDNKFILVTMSTRNGRGNPNFSSTTVLVAIDQHAADERCRVEVLLRDLCAAPRQDDALQPNQLGHSASVQCTRLPNPLKFRISAREADLFKEFAAKFAYWGILYDLIPTPTEQAESHDQLDFIVCTLPTVLAERAKSEPANLISLLRNELWIIAETGDTTRALTGITDEASNDPKPEWLGRIGCCPQGILDMINSRACRSAIMFNDLLPLVECEGLVRRLSSCAFPFQCAHGRPSMVPLIDLGAPCIAEQSSLASSESLGLNSWTPAVGGDTLAEKQSFVAAFTKWRDASVVIGQEMADLAA